MNVDMFTQQIQTLQEHLAQLYQRTNGSEYPLDRLLPSLFKELGTSSEEMQVAAEQLLQQTQEAVALRELEPNQLWLVSQGLVKLTTMGECGQEVLVGLVGSSMPFGSSLTDLPTYQAIALSKKVELVSIPLSEIAIAPRLAQALLPQISERLRQTEVLLAISGRRKVKERLNHLLLFLEEKFGEKMLQGTRLSIRLTHQDLADACCTTRVTITRLLGKLQQQGKIMFDVRNQIVFLKMDVKNCKVGSLLGTRLDKCRSVEKGVDISEPIHL